jgi:hypothetical protein
MNTFVPRLSPILAARLRHCAGVAGALLLAACGGGGQQSGPADPAPAPQSSAVLTLSLDAAPLPEATSAVIARPLYSLAPTLLEAPDERDVDRASGYAAPRTVRLSLAERRLSPRRLTVEAIRKAHLSRVSPNIEGSAAPLAASAFIATYTPAQIRAAYHLPPLPAAGAVLTGAQKAQLGGGQTIYIVNAMHNPNVAAELAAFNQKFGLPDCAVKPLAANTGLPLAAASTKCELSVAYSTPAGGMTTAVPPYESGWATEIALDVQWAHATAPLARIVLIEAADASLNQLLGGVKLANAMGPGVVSMSFGATEGNWTASVDAAFKAPNMTYLAATGDSGASVSWPSVSPAVLAVGGTTLTYSGSGVRSETGWSGTGGGMSAYTPTPAYQNSTVPGVGLPLRRTVADVAFNADPASGQFVAVIANGSSAVNWVSAGGTSLATPQWAALVAIANAQRLLAGKTVLGAAHDVLYGQVAAVPVNYASAFADITKGSNGSCATCLAKTGYDPLAGLGTPNVTSLLETLSGATAAAVAPTVTAAAVSATVGTALTFTVSASGPNALTLSLGGAPSGMAIGATGVVTWPVPLAGTYAVTVLARDGKTGLSGQGVYTVTVAPAPAPVVAARVVSGKVGTALAFTVVATSANPVTYSLSGAPAGMAATSAGSVTWPVPVAGTFAVKVLARDSKTGVQGQGTYTVAIAAPVAPAVSVPAVSGKPGAALTFAATVVCANPVTYRLSGAPSGMTIGATGIVSWAKPVLGNYSVTVVARDGKTGLEGQAVASVKIATAGPVVTAAPMRGVAGKALTGTITVASPGAAYISVSLTGVPLGMGLSFNGLTLTARWPSPVTGNYTINVVVTDSAGLTAKAAVPVTITAK